MLNRVRLAFGSKPDGVIGCAAGSELGWVSQPHWFGESPHGDKPSQAVGIDPKKSLSSTGI
jgi:hypothetical protein